LNVTKKCAHFEVVGQGKDTITDPWKRKSDFVIFWFSKDEQFVVELKNLLCGRANRFNQTN